MASHGNKTRNPGSKKGSARVLPAELRNNQAYKNAYDERVLAHHDLHNAIRALRSAHNQIKSHEKFQQLSSDQHQGSLYTPLTPTEKDAVDAKIAEEKKIIVQEHDRFAAAHQKMRDMEHDAGVDDEHRLARTKTFPNKGRMYGKFGIHNITASHVIGPKDKMEPVEASAQSYMGGRRKKTRKKRRRKNKRKTKRRKKTRRRKKRRKKRRTKRR